MAARLEPSPRDLSNPVYEAPVFIGEMTGEFRLTRSSTTTARRLLLAGSLTLAAALVIVITNGAQQLARAWPDRDPGLPPDQARVIASKWVGNPPQLLTTVRLSRQDGRPVSPGYGIVLWQNVGGQRRDWGSLVNNSTTATPPGCIDTRIGCWGLPPIRSAGPIRFESCWDPGPDPRPWWVRQLAPRRPHLTRFALDGVSFDVPPQPTVKRPGQAPAGAPAPE